jgi:N-acetylneuraminic acid mutarotase
MQFYDIPSNTWTTMPSIPKPLNHVNVAVVDGKVYVLGGLEDAPALVAWNATAESWAFDPETNEWDPIAPLPEGEARGSSAVGVWDGKIILAGGSRALVLSGPGGGFQDTVDMVSIYDTRKREWMELPAPAKRLPEGREHVGGVVVGNKFYLLGGRYRGQSNVKDTVFVLDLNDLENGWKVSKARMPTARGGLCVGAVGKAIYTFGGEGNPELESGVFNETEVYDTERNSWRTLKRMAVPRHGTSAIGVGRKIYIPGGGLVIGGGAPVATFDAFSPFE